MKKQDKNLSQLYHASRRQRMEEVEKLVEDIAKDDPKTFTENFTLERWNRLLKLNNARRYGLGFILLMIICIPAGYGVYRGIVGLIAEPTATTTATTTATASPTSAIFVTETISTSTSVAASTPLTPSAEPTLPPTAANIPDSKFILNNDQIAAQKQPLPSGGAAYYLLTYTDATLVPPSSDQSVWTQATGEAENSYVYAEPNVADVSLEWVMGNSPDSGNYPINVDGYYQVFVSDTTKQSSGDLPYQISVLQNGTNQEGRLVFGESIAFYSSSALGNQKKDGWLPLGVYKIKSGEQLSVKASFTGDGVNFIAVDRLLVVRLSDGDVKLLDALAGMSGSTLISLLDENKADFYVYKDGYQLDMKDWVAAPSVSAWAGQYMSLPESAKKVVKVSWAFPGLFPAGNYKLYALIPESNATVQNATYRWTGNKQIVLNQANQGTWVELGQLTITSEQNMLIDLYFSTVEPGDVGVDAVAIVRLP